MKRKYDVLVIGELNVDLILNDIESFPAMGREITARKMSLVMGSSSAIFACNLASLGNRVGFIGITGRDPYGKLVLENLESRRVDTGLVLMSDAVDTGATIVLNYDLDRAMVTYRGAMEHLTLDNIPFREFSHARHLHLSSFFLQTGLRKDVGEIFRRARQRGLTTSIDIQWDPEEKWDFDFRRILPFIDVFLPNEAEIRGLTGEGDTESAIRKIKDHASIIAVKCGEKGSCLWKGDKLIHRKAFTNDRVVDAIGAGDSFNAGFIHKFLRGSAETECLEFGNLMGAISTTANGGTEAFSDYGRIMEIARTRFNYEE